MEHSKTHNTDSSHLMTTCSVIEAMTVVNKVTGPWSSGCTSLPMFIWSHSGNWLELIMAAASCSHGITFVIFHPSFPQTKSMGKMVGRITPLSHSIKCLILSPVCSSHPWLCCIFAIPCGTPAHLSLPGSSHLPAYWLAYKLSGTCLMNCNSCLMTAMKRARTVIDKLCTHMTLHITTLLSHGNSFPN